MYIVILSMYLMKFLRDGPHTPKEALTTFREGGDGSVVLQLRENRNSSKLKSMRLFHDISVAKSDHYTDGHGSVLNPAFRNFKDSPLYRSKITIQVGLSSEIILTCITALVCAAVKFK